MAEAFQHKVLVLCSGGLDSTTLLALMIERYGRENIEALRIDYGQKHARELQASEAVAAHYGVELHTLDLTDVFAESDCSLLAHSETDIPHESYGAQTAESDGAPVSTYVPFRNGLFLSAASSLALSLNCDILCYGAHSDDAAGSAYPDCSQAFVDAMAHAIDLGTGGTLRMEAPFVRLAKADIVAEGLRLHVPYGLTWSCYEGGDAPCGECATCLDRARAFAANCATDPALKGE